MWSEKFAKKAKLWFYKPKFILYMVWFYFRKLVEWFQSATNSMEALLILYDINRKSLCIDVYNDSFRGKTCISTSKNDTICLLLLP